MFVMDHLVLVLYGGFSLPKYAIDSTSVCKNRGSGCVDYVAWLDHDYLPDA